MVSGAGAGAGTGTGSGSGSGASVPSHGLGSHRPPKHPVGMRSSPVLLSTLRGPVALGVGMVAPEEESYGDGAALTAVVEHTPVMAGAGAGAGPSFPTGSHAFVSEPSPLSRSDLDAMRKSLRTPSFRSAAPGATSPSSEGEAKAAKGDWSGFDVDVFVGVVDYARDRLRETRALLLAIRDTAQHLRTSPSPARSPAASGSAMAHAPMSPRGDASGSPQAAAWSAYTAALRRIQDGVEELGRACPTPSIAVFDPGHAATWQRVMKGSSGDPPSTSPLSSPPTSSP